MSVPALVRTLWWTLKLAPGGLFPTSLSFDASVSELDPPPGYDPYTGLVDGQPFIGQTQEGNLLYAGPIELRKVTMVFSRLGEDVATIGMHLAKLVSGAPDPGWTDANYAQAETDLVKVWNGPNGIRPWYGDATHDLPTAFDRFRWHRVGSGIARPQPAVRETILNLPGTSVGQTSLPPQVAMSVTFKTSRRRSWGRVYLPAMTTFEQTVAGRFDNTGVDQIRTAFGQAQDDLIAHSLPLVVWCPRKSGALLASVVGGDGKKHLETPDGSSFALSVDQVQVDNVYDVIRRRRYDKATYKATHTPA